MAFFTSNPTGRANAVTNRRAMNRTVCRRAVASGGEPCAHRHLRMFSASTNRALPATERALEPTNGDLIY
jgi:hypothetical protein